MDSVKLSQYFERHSMRCPLLQAFNRLHFSPSRKKLLQLLLFIVFVCVVCNFYQISDCVKELTQGRSRVQGERWLITWFAASRGSPRESTDAWDYPKVPESIRFIIRLFFT